MLATNNTVIQTIQVAPEKQLGFSDWQTKLNGKIANHPGFVSLEISAPQGHQTHWSIIQRFLDQKSCADWKNSPEYKELLDDLKVHARDVKEILTSPGLVTEVFLTEVNPNNESSYREWLAKIHAAEARFPGFKGMFVQSPTDANEHKWITCLQFDTPENLDNWLNSSERQEVLKDLKPLIISLESHRVFSPYASWFSSIEKGGKAPPLWKQTMIILLMLFPIVMFEMKYLNPNISSFPVAVAVFVGNAISCALLSWVFMPIAIYFLKNWLTTEDRWVNLRGLLLVMGLYLLEIIVLWDLLK